MVQKNKKCASRDKIIFGIYKYMFGNAYINANGLWINPAYSADKYWKDRLKEIDEAYVYNPNMLEFNWTKTNRGNLIYNAYEDTIKAIESGTYYDEEIEAIK